MESIEEALAQQPLFSGLSALPLLASCAHERQFDAGAYLLREGRAADEFYLLREGRVALEVHVPARSPAILLTLGRGEIVGLSWLAPPYRWSFDARAMQPTRALAIDARCLRGACETDPRLGYELSTRLLSMLVKRLHATRLQHLDLYGDPGA